MDSKKIIFSEQFSQKRKRVVSRFVIGVGASLIVLLSLVFLTSTPKQPFLNPAVQGFSTFSSSSRPFSFSSTPTSSSKNPEFVNDADLGERREETKVFERNNEVDFSNILNNASLSDVLEKPHVLNSSEEVKNGSLSVVEQRVFGDSQSGKNFSLSGEENDANATVVGEVLGFDGNSNDSHLDNGSENVKNVSDNVSGGSLQANLTDREGTSNSSYDSGASKVENNFYGKCNIFDGKWVKDDSKPYYPPGSCPYIDRDFDCHLNGRPDDGYLKWKWQPNDCDIPSMNATDFLERLRRKKLVFVGDSLNRNMWESLVCILRHSIRNKKRDYDCSVDFVSSPFLVRESSSNGVNGSFETLRLDLMDKTTSMYHDADVIIFNTGHWWTHEKTSRGEDYYQEGNYVHPRLKVLEAYKRALTTWAKWVDRNIDAKKTQVFFRGYSLTHFRGGQWNSGGQCHQETEPIFNNTFLAKYPSKMRALDHVLLEMKTLVIYMNISRLTDYRKDAHPSIYRKEYKTEEEKAAALSSQDCSHWCLPGVPDTWNELLYASLLQHGHGSWKNLAEIALEV
ncbi:PC-Esterase [Dillenia turbinata]|uniref:PC-Esterase n=1 Tax=Dillenia turbinata TaxID=194707 RepID=A0AAN8Z8U7_9MAGN